MIKAENLTKRFDDMIAVDHINAEIKDASVFGLIGTNGAGKSTFLRMKRHDRWEECIREGGRQAAVLLHIG